MTWFEKLLASAEGGPGMVHSITKPPPWRGVIEDVTEDTQLKREVEVKRQEWRGHWQIGTPQQN